MPPDDQHGDYSHPPCFPPVSWGHQTFVWHDDGRLIKFGQQRTMGTSASKHSPPVVIVILVS
eukprot:COSAG01_NODE_57500_length_312_cov_0.403756_1_plen_61_part_01